MFTKYLEMSAGFPVEVSDSMELKEMLSFLLEDEQVELFGVGNPDVLMDCVGPSVITMINDTWGTEFKSTYKKHKFEEFEASRNNKALAIDAGLSSNVKDLGKIFISNSPIKPGSGVGRNIIGVGDISIKAVVGVYTPEFEKLSTKEKDEFVFFGESSNKYITFVEDDEIFDLIVAISAAVEEFIIK